MQGTNLWSTGEYTLNCYTQSNQAIVDKYFFVCDDKINDMKVTDLLQNTKRGYNIEPLVILACNDSSIKAIDDRGKLIY